MADELLGFQDEPDGLHRASVVVDGDPMRALDQAVTTLATVGFAIEQRQPNWARLTSSGYNSSRQNPLLGASTVELRTGSRELSLEGDLGGTRFLQRFVRWFPPLLVLILTLPWLVLAALGVVPIEAIWAIAIVAGVQLPLWLVLGPWISKRIRRNTERALDTLVNNAAVNS